MPCPDCGQPLKPEPIGECGCYLHICVNPQCPSNNKAVSLTGAYSINANHCVEKGKE